jgi:HlyD family secretion protein
MKLVLIVFMLAALGGCDQPTSPAWQGYVEGEYAMLASPYAGRLLKLHVRRGGQVEAGKPVFVLEQEAELAGRREAEERLKMAQARLENLAAGRRPAEIDVLRAELKQANVARELSASQLAQQQKLFKGGFIAQARLDEAQTAHARDAARVAEVEAQLKNALQPLGREAERKAAESEVAAARQALAQAAWRLEQKSIAAPVSGFVQETYFVEGEWVPAGRPVTSILAPGNVKLRFYVPETALGALQLEQPLEVRCDGCPAPIAARVSFISRQAEFTPPVLYSKDSRTKLVFLIEARPSPSDAMTLHPGQPVDVSPR